MAPMWLGDVCEMALVGFQGRGCANGVQPDFCHSLFRDTLLFQLAFNMRDDSRTTLEHKSTVCLDVMSLIASSCGYNRGEIELRVAHEFPAHMATQRGLAERPQHRHPPRVQPGAPVR
jgi:hypothetical protein